MDQNEGDPPPPKTQKEDDEPLSEWQQSVTVTSFSTSALFMSNTCLKYSLYLKSSKLFYL
jgi:hypothetical protein